VGGSCLDLTGAFVLELLGAAEEVFSWQPLLPRRDRNLTSQWTRSGGLLPSETTDMEACMSLLFDVVVVFSLTPFGSVDAGDPNRPANNKLAQAIPQEPEEGAEC
jgi:hypothetical protein